jgi:hypothetical protein
MHKRTLIATLTISAMTAASIATTHAQQQGKSTGTPSDKAGVYSATPVHSESMEKLERAAQRLRESIQALAQKPAGAERDTAVGAARRALLETQQAMTALPPEYRVEGMVTSNRPIEHGNMAQNRTFDDSMKELQRAADRLRGAIQAMAQRPAGASRNDAIKQAHSALFETQQAMVMVPGVPQPTVGSTESSSGASAGGSGTAAGGSGGR